MQWVGWSALLLTLLLWSLHLTRGLGQKEIYTWWLHHLPWIFAGAAGLMVFALIQAYITRRNAQQALRARAVHSLDFSTQSQGWRPRARRIVQALWQHVLAMAPVRWLLGPWSAAGISPGFLMLLWMGAGILGALIFFWRPILGFLFWLLSFGGLRAWVWQRARQQARRFHDQLPEALDRLADALQAGFSFFQAVDFIHPNVDEPMRTELERIGIHVRLGRPLEEAFEDLYRRYSSPEMHMLVKGLRVQRRVGGNLTELLRRLAFLVRERITLEHEVRTLTAQGRLSAWVIVLLVPVSLFLLRFFPTYHHFLWNTSAGNLVLGIVVLLEVAGFFVIRRILRVEY